MNRHECFSAMHKPIFLTKIFRNNVGNSNRQRFNLHFTIYLRSVKLPFLRDIIRGIICRLRWQILASTQRIHVFQYRFVNMFAGNPGIRMIYRSRTADSFQCFINRLRIVFQITKRWICRIAETVIPFPAFCLRLHGIDGKQVGMRELQTIVIHAWLACDDQQRSRVQFALHPVDIRFAI